MNVPCFAQFVGFVDVPSVSLLALTEGLHSREALDLVKEHLLSVMGPTTLSQFSNAAVKMSKFQMAQVRLPSAFPGSCVDSEQ